MTMASELSSQRLSLTSFTMNANWFRCGSGRPNGRRLLLAFVHSGAVRLGLDGRTVTIGVLAVVLALALGAWAGTQVGALGGALAALASLVPSAVLVVVVELRQRNLVQMKKRQEVLRRFAPPRPTGDREGEE